MDKYDPENHVKLLIDEWGTWWDVEPGTNPGHLFQQNTMRDAVVAATTFDIFHKYTERINMTNIAQMVNVLQAMLLTQDDKMVKTPTYFVYKMYNTHRRNKYVPAEVRSDLLQKAEGILADVHSISSTTSISDAGKLSISVTNVNLDNDVDVTVNLGAAGKTFKAEILASPDIRDYNSFDVPDKVETQPFSAFGVDGQSLTFTIPAHSIVTFVEQ
jgi:alpha-N-arabinofuranosidase